MALVALSLAATLLPLPAPVRAAPAVAPITTAVLDGLPPATRATAPARDEAEHSEVRSLAVRTPIGFSLVGVRVPAGATVALRTSPDGQRWSAWRAAEVDQDEGPDPASSEGPAEGSAGLPVAAGPPAHSLPLWVGESRWIQVRVRGASPAAVGVHLIDSLGLDRGWPQRLWDGVRAAVRPTVVPAAADTDGPDIVGRSEWGAAAAGAPALARRLRLAFVHHTAGSNSYSAAEAPAVVRAIQRYHMSTRGWKDIGYPFLIDRFGTIYEGRAGGVEEAVIGAHAGGFNTGSTGVALLGTFDGAGPSPAAIEALEALLTWKLDVHHVDALGTYTATSGGSSRYPSGRSVTLATVSGHRDVSSTSCPGEAVYADLPRLRERLAERAGPVLLDHAAAPSSITMVRGQSLEGAVTLSTRLRPAGSWQLAVTAADGTVVHRDRGDGAVARSVWDPQGAALGTYRYTFSSAGRRAASDVVRLLPPTISDPQVEPGSVLRDSAGTLHPPVEFEADLYPGASWEVTVSRADGAPVHRSTGSGETLSGRWTGPAPSAGTYRWRMASDDAEPVSGELEVLDRVLTRMAASEDAPGAAVAVAQAAFPVPLSAEHAVLAREDVFADALTGGPLAGSGGPVLLTAGDRLDPRVREELERVLPPGATVYLLGGPAALAERVAESVRARWNVVRLAGADRTATAAAVAARVVARTGSTTALVARAGPDAAAAWADAIAGGAYGAATGVPVLLTATAALSPPTAAALRDLGIRSTVILGGSNAVGDAVERELPGPRRIAGGDRTATAVAVATQLWGRQTGRGGDAFVLANGYDADAWTLALAATPLAARQRAPLLLSDSEDLQHATRDYLAALRYGDGRSASGWVLGGLAAVSDAVLVEATRLLQ